MMYVERNLRSKLDLGKKQEIVKPARAPGADVILSFQISEMSQQYLCVNPTCVWRGVGRREGEKP